LSSNIKPFVSIIVPVYNNRSKIENCIKSLLKINYPKDRLEIIVVDNNSNDGTWDIIEKYEIRAVVEKTIQSSYAARNRGIKEASGEILAFTDSDCIADQNWIIEATECFKDKNVGCVAGRIEGYQKTNYIEKYLIKQKCLSQGLTRFLPYAQTANAIYRKDVLKKIGIFEESWISGGDSDLTWRMLLRSNFKLKNCNKAIIYHVHRSNLKTFFKQRVTWGFGEVLLYKKYKNVYGNIDGERNREFKEFFLTLKKNLRLMVFNKVVAKNKELYLEHKLNIIAMIGRRFGRIKGSIYLKEFYI
jgi:cellulose synthase/poly-beta-1,6-N-acetylglucosamine synthase-like glycosyltransferase